MYLGVFILLRILFLVLCIEMFGGHFFCKKKVYEYQNVLIDQQVTKTLQSWGSFNPKKMNWSSHYDFWVLHMLGNEKSIRGESFVGPIKRYPYFHFHSSIKSHSKLSFLNNFVHFSCIFWLFMKEQLVIMIVWV